MLTLQYDLNGRRIELGHPTSVAPRNGTTGQVYATQSYDYDPETGALFHVTDVLGNTFTLSYDAYGRSSRILAPGGTEVNRGYDVDGNMTFLSAFSPNYGGTGAPTTIFSDSLSPNARGQIEYVSGTDHPSFTYSTLGHLKRYSSGASSQGGEIDTYQTDALGHRGVVTEKGMETVTTYIAGTDRIDTTGPSPTLPDPNAPSSSNSYDLAGNVISFHKSSSVGTSPTDPSQGTRNIEETRNYYDADQHLVASDRKICVLVITAWTDPSPTATCKGPGELDDSNANVFEWYRYDALGRRVLMRTRRDHNCSTDACASSITRNVWDGNELLYEIRSSGGKVGPATLENDHASGDNYGSVAYTHGLGIDQPLDLVRIGYPDDFGVEYDMQHWGGPFAIVPLADWRGGYRAGTMANGHRTPCGPGEGCEMLTWPADNYTPFWDAREPVSRKNWFGSLVLASKDGSGLMYRRNRYYNPTTGQFTQEDPIGLAGGLNLYGFANGDPVTFSDPFGLMAEGGPCILDPMCIVQEGADAVNSFVRRASEGIARFASDLSGLSGALEAKSEAQGGNYAAAAGTLLLTFGPDLLPAGGAVAANLRRTLKAAGGADVTVSKFGKWYKATWEIAGTDGGESRAIYTKFINQEGNTLKLYKDSYDRAGVFQHRKFKYPDEHIAY